MSGYAKEWCSERQYGEVSRSAQLPLEIEESKADASYVDGVLHLTLPQRAIQHGPKAGDSLA